MPTIGYHKAPLCKGDTAKRWGIGYTQRIPSPIYNRYYIRAHYRENRRPQEIVVGFGVFGIGTTVFSEIVNLPHNHAENRGFFGENFFEKSIDFALDFV